jgi:hypothetical protein
VQTKNLRLQFVLDDTVTPAAAVQHMKASAPSSVQVVEYETKHQQYDAMGGGRAFDWIKQQLQAPGSHIENAQADDNEHKAQNEKAH